MNPINKINKNELNFQFNQATKDFYRNSYSTNFDPNLKIHLTFCSLL